MASGLVAGQLGDSRVLLRDVAMHRAVLSMDFKHLALQARAFR
jgi:hypothetical protein